VAQRSDERRWVRAGGLAGGGADLAVLGAARARWLWRWQSESRRTPHSAARRRRRSPSSSRSIERDLGSTQALYSKLCVPAPLDELARLALLLLPTRHRCGRVRRLLDAGSLSLVAASSAMTSLQSVREARTWSLRRRR